MRRLTISFLVLTIAVLSLSYFVATVHAEPSLNEVLQTLGFTNIAKMDTLDVTFPPGTYKITLYAEFAAYHAGNELSYYHVGTTTYNLVFAGSEGGFGYISPPITKTLVIDSQFGLSMFVTKEAHRYFTENSLNPDEQIHAIIYENLDDQTMFLIGFENLYGAGDRDYQDIVMSLQLMTFQHVIPEVPLGTVAITASMFIALLGYLSSKRYRMLR